MGATQIDWLGAKSIVFAPHYKGAKRSGPQTWPADCLQLLAGFGAPRGVTSGREQLNQAAG